MLDILPVVGERLHDAESMGKMLFKILQYR
jgi:hypothetical protein